MNFCQPHWDLLRAAIADRGLSALVAKGGKEAAKLFNAELNGDTSGFDPLMQAWGMIIDRHNSIWGFTMSCPLCGVQIHEDSCSLPESECDARVPSWIDGSTNAVLEHAKELGLIKVS